MDGLEQELETLQAEKGPLEKQIEDISTTLAEKTAVQDGLKEHEREMNHRIRSRRKDDRAIRERLQETRERLENEGLEAKREVDRLSQRVKDAHHRLHQILEPQDTEALRRIDRAKEEIQGREKRAHFNRQRKQQLDYDAKQHREILSDLEAQAKNNLLAYGPGMPGLIRAIQRETRWHRPPIGPFGLYMTVRDGKWMEILETLVGQATGDFLVEDHHDQTLLVSLIRQQQGVFRSKVIISGKDLFDYSKGEPDPRFLTILRALEFTDEHVKRQLINAFRIEASILIDSRSEADRVMRSGPGGNPPKNVRRCVTRQGFEVGGGSKGRSTIALSLYRGAPRLRESQGGEGERRMELKRDEIRKAINTALIEAREAVEAAREQDSLAMEARAELAQLEQAQRRTEQEKVEGLHQLRSLEGELEGAKEALREGSRQSLEQKIQILEQEQEKIQNEMKMIKDQFSSVAEQRVNLEEGMARLQKEVHQVQAELRTLIQRRSDIQNELRSLLGQMEELKEGKARFEAHLGTERSKVEEKEEKERFLRQEQMVGPFHYFKHRSCLGRKGRLRGQWAFLLSLNSLFPPNSVLLIWPMNFAHGFLSLRILLLLIERSKRWNDG